MRTKFYCTQGQPVSAGIHKIFGLLFFSACLFFITPMYAQEGNGPDMNILASVVWKTNADLNETLTQERARISSILEIPELQETDRAIFLACRLLIGYILEDILADKAVAEAIMSGYNKVLTEAPKSTDMWKLPEHALGSFIPGLVEMLTVVPQPEPRSN